MRSYTEYLWFQTPKRREYVNITARVAEALAKSGIREGLCLVSAMHITAGVFVNDAEEGFLADLDDMLERLAPYGRDPTGREYRHHRTGEDNGDAHLKNILVHHQVVVPVTEGRLDLGPWQQIYYAEFDGRRRKRVVIKIIGE
jgi:secondary thiamine-phosphate synthase enzyme